MLEHLKTGGDILLEKRTWIIIGAAASVVMIILAFYVYLLTKEEESPVPNRAPLAYISPKSMEVEMGETIHFSAKESYDPDGNELSYFWEFGDGYTSHEMEVNHSYDRGDIIYQVNLTVSDGLLNGTGYVAITVVIPPELKAAQVSLSSQTVDIPLLGKYYTVTVLHVGPGDVSIRNISYELAPPGSNETLAGGRDESVYNASQTSADSPVKYYTGDEDMDDFDYFQISVDKTNATEGDFFRLYHMPTGLLMGSCRLLG